MCFSATASFTAGVALSAVGVVTIKKLKTKSALPFASIPLLFGIQQIIEGGVWLSFKYGMPFLNQIATYSFLFFGYLLWPIFVPFSIGLLEQDLKRKKIIRGFLAVGIMVSLYLLYFLAISPISSQIVNQCIYYTKPLEYGIIPIVFYWLATSVSCMFSSHRIINFLGIASTVFLAISYYFYTATFVSVWCFFAAILSLVVFLYFTKWN